MTAPPPPSVVDWSFGLSLGLPALVVIVGWIVGHLLTEQRELAGRRRETRLTELSKAYKQLIATVNRTMDRDELIDGVEDFVASIQLYGSPEQIRLMQELVDAFKQGGRVSLDAILNSLRNEIREELQLEPVKGDIWWLRLNRPQLPSPADAGGQDTPPAS